MPWFLTEYRANWRTHDPKEDVCAPGSYGAHLWAGSFRTAKRRAIERGMGERVVSKGFKGPAPYKPASKMMRSKKYSQTEKIHALCYLGQIAIASGAVPAQDIIGDKGIVHDFCHGANRDKGFLEKVKYIESVTPGYLAR